MWEGGWLNAGAFRGATSLHLAEAPAKGARLLLPGGWRGGHGMPCPYGRDWVARWALGSMGFVLTWLSPRSMEFSAEGVTGVGMGRMRMDSRFRGNDGGGAALSVGFE